MKKLKFIAVFVFFLLLGINISYWLEETYTSPTWWDISLSVSNSSTCTSSDMIWVDESDRWLVWETYWPYHYCVAKWFSTYSSYILNDVANDPDICETKSTTADNTPTFQFDTSWVDEYTSITCFVDDSNVGCSLPNALNYDPSVIYTDNTLCIYTDNTWSWTSSEVVVNIENWEGINKPVFTEEFLIEFYQIQALWMVVLVFLRFFYRLITWKRKKRLF